MDCSLTLLFLPWPKRTRSAQENAGYFLMHWTFSSAVKTRGLLQTKNVSQAFLLQLLALDGVSPAKASAIVAKYPTLRRWTSNVNEQHIIINYVTYACHCRKFLNLVFRLLKAYDLLSSDHEKKIMLRDIKFGSGLTWVISFKRGSSLWQMKLLTCTVFLQEFRACNKQETFQTLLLEWTSSMKTWQEFHFFWPFEFRLLAQTNVLQTLLYTVYCCSKCNSEKDYSSRFVSCLPNGGEFDKILNIVTTSWGFNIKFCW